MSHSPRTTATPKAAPRAGRSERGLLAFLAVVLILGLGATLFWITQRGTAATAPDAVAAEGIASPAVLVQPVPTEEAPRAREVTTLDLDAGDADLVVVVIDAGGRGISTARVQLRHEAQTQARTTDASGRAPFDELAPGEYGLTVELPAGSVFERADTLLLTEDSAVVEVIVPTAFESIEGRITDSDGQALSGVRVSARELRRAAPAGSLVLGGGARPTSVTDLRGDYVLRDLPTGLFALQASSAGFATATFDARAGERGANAALVRSTELRVAGLVRSAETGLPIEKARVALQGAGSRSTLTDADGIFSITIATSLHSLPHLRVSASGHTPALNTLESPNDPAQLEQLQIELEPAHDRGILEGQVYAPSGAPATEASIVLRGVVERWTTQTDSSGSFFFDDVPLGDYTLEVSHESAQWPVRREVRPAGPALRIQLEEEVLRSIRGRVVDAWSQPQSDLFYEVVSDGALGDAVPRPLRTDRRGEFEVVDVPCGSIRFTSQGATTHTTRGLLLEPEAQAEVTLIANVGDYALDGAVREVSGGRVAGAQVQLMTTRTEHGLTHASERSTHSAADGSYRFTGLGPGPHRVSVTAPGFAGVSREVDPERFSGILEITLQPAGAPKAGPR